MASHAMSISTGGFALEDVRLPQQHTPTHYLGGRTGAQDTERRDRHSYANLQLDNTQPECYNFSAAEHRQPDVVSSIVHVGGRD